jgi:CHAD domain-containing protein
MEIEAKFSIPNQRVFSELQTVSTLDDFTLSPPRRRNVRDIYFDTAERHIWKTGYAFRRRGWSDGTLITLKALRGGEETVKRREETEVFIPREDASTIPDAAALNAVRQRVRELTEGSKLNPLFQLDQQRIKRVAIIDEREVAELSIDSVQMVETAEQRRETFHVLEIELLPDGNEDDLAALIQRCQARWDLVPDPRTKLERAQTFYQVEMPPLPWLAAQDEPEEQPEPLPLAILLERYEVDLDHADHVAEHALQLFDMLALAHHLPLERRDLLRTAALVHNIGDMTDHKHRHKAGEEILLQHPPADLDADERRIVAATTYLHRKRIKRKRLRKLQARPYFTALAPETRDEALALAALLRMAVALEKSRSGTTQIKDVERQEHHIDIQVTGPHAAKDAASAEKRTDLWRHCFGSHIIFEPPDVSAMNLLTHLLDMPEDVPPDEITLPPAPHLKADDTMAEAAHKTFLFHFERMLYHEAGTRQGEDIEALHDMRVATRRMRNAARLFEEYLVPEVKPFIKGIKRTNRALGAVRDLDVFWKKTEDYLSSAEKDGKQPDLSPLKTAWSEAHQAAREKMLRYLDSKKYRKFKRRFGQYLQSPWPETQPRFTKKGEAVPHRLRHIAPILIYQRLANLRAYEDVLPGEEVDLNRYHRLRIAVKYFRYTLEYFEEVLGPDVETLISRIKKLQDHLGDLQDAVVASNILRDFLLWGTWGDADHQGSPPAWPSQVVVAPDVVAYLETRQKEIQYYLETFPEAWSWFQSQAFRQLVADTVAVL